MTYGEHAKAAREEAGFSQARLEREAGVARGVIQRLESADKLPSLKSALAVCRVLDIGLDRYFGIEPEHTAWSQRTGSMGAHAAAVRLRKGLTMDELAEAAQVVTSTVYKLECGLSRVRMTTILLLAEALGVTPDEYLGLPCPEERYYCDL